MGSPKNGALEKAVSLSSGKLTSQRNIRICNRKYSTSAKGPFSIAMLVYRSVTFGNLLYFIEFVLSTSSFWIQTAHILHIFLPCFFAVYLYIYIHIYQYLPVEVQCLNPKRWWIDTLMLKPCKAPKLEGWGIHLSGWWFQIFFIFTHIWGRFPFWLIFFNWVETTNQLYIQTYTPLRSEKTNCRSLPSPNLQVPSTARGNKKRFAVCNSRFSGPPKFDLV